MASVPLTVGRGCDQPRFVTPLPDRMGHAVPSGNVLLTLTRGLSTRTSEQIETARGFGMSRIGDQALIRGSDQRALKAAYEIQHMLAITFLPHDYVVDPTRKQTGTYRRVPGTDWYVPQEHLRTARPTEKRVLDRAIAEAEQLPVGARTVGGFMKGQRLRPEFELEGGYYEFANEEYFHVEADDDGAIVLWSSEMPADAAASAVERFLGRPQDDCHGFVVSDTGDGMDETSARVIDTAKEHPDHLKMVTVGFDDCIVSWRQPQTKMVKHTVPHVEVSFSARHVDSKNLSDLMHETASPNVSRALAKGGWDLIESLVDPGHKRARKKR